jgi:hypothetical protein
MLREERQHVIEKRNSGLDGRLTVAINRQLEIDFRLVRFAANPCLPAFHPRH